MLKHLVELFYPPRHDDDDKNRIALFLHIIIIVASTIAVTVALVDALNGVFVTVWAMTALVFPLIVAYWANRFGRTTVASYIVVLGSVTGVTIILSVGQGIHDIGIIDYGLILIISSYLLRRKGIFVVTVAIIASVAIVTFGEINNLLPVQVSPDKFQPRVADFLIVTLSLVIGAVGIDLLSRTLENAIQKSKASELRWRSLIESIPDVVVMFDQRGQVTAVNHETSRLARFYIGKTAYEFIAPEHREMIAADVASIMGGASLTREVKLLTSQETWRWFSVSMGPLRQPDGSINGAIAVVRDIQQNKNAEEELRRSRETLQAQTQQLTTLQEISRTISGLQDVKGTLQLILEQVKAILPLDGFVVALYDHETNLLSFPLVYDEGNIYQDVARPLFPESVFAEAILTRKAHFWSRTEEQIRDELISSQDLMGTKKPSASFLNVPMIAHDRVIGALSAQSYSINAYSLENISVLAGAANQVAIAIENARLYETSQKRADQLATLNEIGRSISSLRDLNGVLENTYQLLKHTLNLDAFYIALYHPETKSISYPIVVDEDKFWHEEPTPLIENAQLTRTILSAQPYLVNRSVEEIDKRRANIQHQNALGEHSKVSASLMLAPLQFGRKVLGAISAQSYTIDAYTNDDLDLLTGVATQVAIAIENARLYTAQQKELAEKKRAEAEVRHLNAELEARVRQRTAELEAANQELASFTYTVSHDLRAPIRGIHGLSYIILDEFKANLPATVVAHLQRIQANARQMGLLIDELLAFTHLGRQPVRKTRLDLDDLCRFIFNGLIESQSRPIELTIRKLPPAYGDIALMRQALTNLLENAIKFTSLTPQPKIEIGSRQHQDEIVYFIRDNGAGFDMTYAKKLFGVFERLHRQDEFEGIGVGLAIVKRIIDKHGGRIWAEGQVGAGATFYFTLPPQK